MPFDCDPCPGKRQMVVMRARAASRAILSEMPAAPPSIDSRRVAGYYADIAALDVDARATRLAAWLDPAERLRYHRFRGDDDRQMFLMGRVMARTLVGRALRVRPTAW